MMIKAVGYILTNQRASCSKGIRICITQAFGFIIMKLINVYGSAFCLVIPEGSIPEKRPCLQKPLWDCSTGTKYQMLVLFFFFFFSGTKYQVRYYDVLKKDTCTCSFPRECNIRASREVNSCH